MRSSRVGSRAVLDSLHDVMAKLREARNVVGFA